MLQTVGSGGAGGAGEAEGDSTEEVAPIPIANNTEKKNKIRRTRPQPVLVTSGNPK